MEKLNSTDNRYICEQDEEYSIVMNSNFSKALTFGESVNFYWDI